jgi:hypothetical protein
MIRDVIPRRRQTGHPVIIEGTCSSCVIGTAGRLSLNRADAGTDQPVRRSADGAQAEAGARAYRRYVGYKTFDQMAGELKA